MKKKNVLLLLVLTISANMLIVSKNPSICEILDVSLVGIRF